MLPAHLIQDVVKPFKSIKMYKNLVETINNVTTFQNISEERKNILRPLIDFVQQKVNNSQEISINFICTHNSRRSHLSQVWAQVAAAHYVIPKVHCYSGWYRRNGIIPESGRSIDTSGIKYFQNSRYRQSCICHKV